MCTPYPKFLLTGVIYIENALKGIEIVLVIIYYISDVHLGADRSYSNFDLGPN